VLCVKREFASKIMEQEYMKKKLKVIAYFSFHTCIMASAEDLALAKPNEHKATYTCVSTSGLPLLKPLKPAPPELLQQFIRELVKNNAQLSNKQLLIMISEAHALNEPNSSILPEVIVLPYRKTGHKSSL